MHQLVLSIRNFANVREEIKLNFDCEKGVCVNDVF